MKTKKEILKEKCDAKGGPLKKVLGFTAKSIINPVSMLKPAYDVLNKKGKNGVSAVDVAKEVPGTVLGMHKNIIKAMDPGKVLGKIGNGIKKGINSLVQPTIDYNKAQKDQDDKWRKEGEDMMNGREKYVPEKKEILKQAVKKTGVGTRYPDMAPLKTSMPAPKALKQMPVKKGNIITRK